MKLFAHLRSLQSSSITVDDTRSVDSIELTKVMLAASEKAWQEAIQPRMQQIREGAVDPSSIKDGTDFFTQADVESERIIQKELISHFGQDAFRIFGEEDNAYTGNQDSNITVRIDPIDGTESFKFGKPSWSIMIGVYIGRGKDEHQVLASVYYPEIYNEVIYSIEGVGVYVGNTVTGDVQTISTLQNQDDIGNMIIAYWKHPNVQKRGNIDPILRRLEENGARCRGLSTAEVREALITGGKRAMIIDGDFNQVDYISYSILGKLGYTFYTWDGVQCSVDDPNFANTKFVALPPGKAAQQVLEIVKNVV